jgi:Flp pilus assembly protein TadD
MVDLLWNLSKNPEKQMEAVQTLYRYYAKNGDTAGLYRVLVRWSEVAPDDLNVKNNLAQVSLLLGADRDQARRTAAELYEKAPSNPAYATTYAYSLLSNGKVDAARQVMNKLTEAQLRDPTISLYYGICLAASHDEKARPFLEEGLQAKMLLPEEKALLQKALANLNSSAGR